MELAQISTDASNASCYQKYVQASVPVSLLLEQEGKSMEMSAC
jgi:hypothetical protein